MHPAVTYSLLAATLTSLVSAAIPNVFITAYTYETDSNVTLRANLGEVFTDPVNLDQVSTLYLTGLSNAEISLDTVVCTPYKTSEANDLNHGLPFWEGSPSFLSTNEVVVGSIYCSSTALSYV